MSWNGTTPNAPNWTGKVGGDGGVGDLYILPDPPSVVENPSIGLEGRNLVPLPLAYKDFAVDNLTANNINGNPSFDASNWYLYPANGNVTATLNPLFNAPQWDISGFEAISCVTLNTTQNVECGNTINAVLGNLGALNCPDILMSPGDETGTLALYGANKIAGQNALYVEGGTTLTGGGVIHGTTIGALNVGGIDTVRIDVLPAGIGITSATFVATSAAGAASLVAGGALALAGGSYISYNSDQHYFTNTSAGNDFTDIYVGNIHAADGGSAPLRINDAGRGVELADVKSMTMRSDLPIADWGDVTTYEIGDKVKLSGVYYNCLVSNNNTLPNAPIPNWISGGTYDPFTVVFSDGFVFRCSSYVSGSTDAPIDDPTHWNNLGFTTNVITQIWAVYNPFVANITGDTFSNITIGKITAPVDFVKVAGSGLQGVTQFEGLSGFNYLELVAQDGSANSLQFLNSAAVLQAQISSNNGDGKLLIQSDTGLVVNTTGVTTTNFSGKNVENVKTLTLTSTIGSPWNVANPYAEGDKVEYDNGNWISQFGVNQQNIPSATLQNWNNSGFYVIGAVRYYATNNTAYICILGVFGLSMPTPNTDPSHWSVFQVGSSGEDVWFPTTAPVQSSIVGDRASALQIGQIACVGDLGSYLEIAPDPENDANATVQSAGLLGLLGDQGVQIGATNSDVNVISVIGDIQLLAEAGAVVVNANTLVGINASVGGVAIVGETNVNITATTGSITLTSDGASSITSSANSLTLSSAEATSITSTANAVNLTGFLGVNINSPNAISLTSSASDVNITAGTGHKVIVNSILDLTNKNVVNANTITGQGALTLATTGATNLNLSPGTGGVIVGNKNLSMGTINAITNCIGMSSDNALSFTANNGNVNLTATGSGNRVIVNSEMNMANNNIINANTITGLTALSLASTNGNVNLTAGGSGNRINFNSDAQFNNRTLFNFTGTNVGGIYGLTTQALALVGQQSTPQIHLRGATQMWLNSTTQAPGNSISGVTTLNGRNLFSYGNFYNTATQTLGASNTATRIQMNTSANSNLITLDSVTNIGRLTFTNAGVYQVSWSAYLLHGSGGIAKTVIWIRLNGTDVAGSGKTENNDSQLNETNLASTSLVSVTANQYIEFYWAATTTNVPLTTIAASSPYPATPSFACSIQIVG